MYNARSLSFNGCEFNTVEDAVPAPLIMKYDECCALFIEIFNKVKKGIISGKLKYPVKGGADKEGSSLEGEEGYNFDDDDDDDDDDDVDADLKPLEIPSKQDVFKYVTRYFWGCHLRFFKSLTVSMKINAAVHIARSAREAGNAVVVGLQVSYLYSIIIITTTTIPFINTNTNTNTNISITLGHRRSKYEQRRCR